MAAFHPAVVLLASHGVALQVSIEGSEEAFAQGGDPFGVVTAELHSPVCLEGDRSADTAGSQP